MLFDNFGVISFTSDAKVSPFVGYLEKGKVMATRCQTCGRVFFPPKIDCPDCIVSTIEWVEISSIGTLLTFTVVHYGPSGFENEVPYILGIAQFSEGIKVLGRMSKTVNPNDVEVGMKVKLSPVKMSSERLIYEFIPNVNKV